MGIISRYGGAFRPRGEGGGSPPRKRWRKTSHYGWAPHAGDWRTGPQTLYFITPSGGPLGKFGSPGMMGADDGWVPPRRDATNLNPPRPAHLLP